MSELYKGGRPEEKLWAFLFILSVADTRVLKTFFIKPL
jgi:hypothetical protein